MQASRCLSLEIADARARLFPYVYLFHSLLLTHPMGVVVVLICFVFVYMDGGEMVVYIWVEEK